MLSGVLGQFPEKAGNLYTHTGASFIPYKADAENWGVISPRSIPAG